MSIREYYIYNIYLTLDNWDNTDWSCCRRHEWWWWRWRWKHVMICDDLTQNSVISSTRIIFDVNGLNNILSILYLEIERTGGIFLLDSSTDEMPCLPAWGLAGYSSARIGKVLGYNCTTRRNREDIQCAWILIKSLPCWSKMITSCAFNLFAWVLSVVAIYILYYLFLYILLYNICIIYYIYKFSQHVHQISSSLLRMIANRMDTDKSC
jgi:hypothetical protein